MARRATSPGRVLLVAAAFGFAAPTEAHLGGGEGVVPFIEGGVVIGAGTTWGLIGAAGAGYSQTCEEAIGDVPRDFVRVIDDDGAPHVFAATGAGVSVSVDDGCTWRPAAGTADRAVLALSAVNESLVAVTADPGQPNQVLVSDDGGATFSPRHTTAATVLLTSLAAGEGGALLVAGSDTGTATPLLLFGDAASLAPLPGPFLNDARLARALTVDADALWCSTLDGIGRGHLWRIPRVDGVPVVDEAVDVGAFDGLVRATGIAGGRRFAIAASGILFRVVDDGAAIDPAGWVRTTEGPLACLRRVVGDDRLWGCGTQLDEVWFKATRDGVTWDTVLPFDGVTDRVCPAETPAAAACAHRFAPPADDIPAGETPDTPATATQPSCAAGGAPLSWLSWLSWLLLVRWRRQRQR